MTNFDGTISFKFPISALKEGSPVTSTSGIHVLGFQNVLHSEHPFQSSFYHLLALNETDVNQICICRFT